MRQPKEVFQVFQTHESADGYPEPELIGTFYSPERALAFQMQTNLREYEGYVRENARQLVEAKRRAAAMDDFSIAYSDWEQASRLAPTKALRVEATAMVQYIRAMRPRPALDSDWRDIAEQIKARSGLSHEAWTRAGYGSCSVVSVLIEDAEA
jgi:hypothetical protein